MSPADGQSCHVEQEPYVRGLIAQCQDAGYPLQLLTDHDVQRGWLCICLGLPYALLKEVSAYKHEIRQVLMQDKQKESAGGDAPC